jgi:hypothetical protein
MTKPVIDITVKRSDLEEFQRTISDAFFSVKDEADKELEKELYESVHKIDSIIREADREHNPMGFIVQRDKKK